MKKPKVVIVAIILAVLAYVGCDMGGNSPASDANPQGDVSAEDSVAPGEVLGLGITVGDGSATLSWTEPSDEDFAKVKITYEPGGETAVEVPKGTTSKQITGLVNEATFSFTVKTVDTSGNLSDGVTLSNIKVTAGDVYVQGYVFERITKTPIQGATVSIGSHSATTDSKGHFQFSLLLSDAIGQKWMVKAEHYSVEASDQSDYVGIVKSDYCRIVLSPLYRDLYGQWTLSRINADSGGNGGDAPGSDYSYITRMQWWSDGTCTYTDTTGNMIGDAMPPKLPSPAIGQGAQYWMSWDGPSEGTYYLGYGLSYRFLLTDLYGPAYFTVKDDTLIVHGGSGRVDVFDKGTGSTGTGTGTFTFKGSQFTGDVSVVAAASSPAGVEVWSLLDSSSYSVAAVNPPSTGSVSIDSSYYTGGMLSKPGLQIVSLSSYESWIAVSGTLSRSGNTLTFSVSVKTATDIVLGGGTSYSLSGSMTSS